MVAQRIGRSVLRKEDLRFSMPSADDLPGFDVSLTSTLCTHTPPGAKGCGETGAIGSLGAIISAVTDAVGIMDFSMPVTPEKVWRAIQAVRA